MELKRTSRLGAQVVRINAELLHFHSIPPASESSTGGIDLTGTKSAAQASVRNATMSKGRFIASSLVPGVQISAVFLDLPSECYQALVSACLRGQGKWLRPIGQIVSWPPGRRNLFTRSRPQSGMLAGERYALNTGHWAAAFNSARNPRAAYLT